MKIPQYIEEIISTVNKNGYEAYVVGGAVRDNLLNITPTDYDVTTSCPPEKIISLFDNTVPTGLKHGTVTVIKNKIATEVTTYRIDGNYSDARSPDSVEFTNNLSLDLSRRDFTINAMAYSSDAGLIDLFCGTEDIKNKIIRTVGDPKKRFCEDALRILRAIRFACQLNFSIEKSTLSAALKYAGTLSKISKERVFTELSKALLGECGDMLEFFIKNGGLEFLGINSAQSLKPIYKAPKNLASRFFIFFVLTDADFGKISSELKFSNNLHSNVSALLDLNSEILNDDKITLKHLLNKYSPVVLEEYLECLSILYDRDVSKILDKINEIIDNNEVYKISMLDIRGNDLLTLGFKGEIIGIILNDLLNQCIIDPKYNNKAVLIDFIKSKYSN